ncbi:MAG: hypothetical protein ACREHG_10220 [Candidatus Saccharimonadales bacterium]
MTVVIPEAAELVAKKGAQVVASKAKSKAVSKGESKAGQTIQGRTTKAKTTPRGKATNISSASKKSKYTGPTYKSPKGKSKTSVNAKKLAQTRLKRRQPVGRPPTLRKDTHTNKDEAIQRGLHNFLRGRTAKEYTHMLVGEWLVCSVIVAIEPLVTKGDTLTKGGYASSRFWKRFASVQAVFFVLSLATTSKALSRWAVMFGGLIFLAFMLSTHNFIFLLAESIGGYSSKGRPEQTTFSHMGDPKSGLPQVIANVPQTNGNRNNNE